PACHPRTRLDLNARRVYHPATRQPAGACRVAAGRARSRSEVAHGRPCGEIAGARGGAGFARALARPGPAGPAAGRRRRVAPLADLMRLSAQLASSLASVLLVIPMYYLGKLLFHRAAGFWAALMFQCLPVTGHILGDGLSEALFLLLTTSGLLFGAQALHGKS